MNRPYFIDYWERLLENSVNTISGMLKGWRNENVIAEEHEHTHLRTDAVWVSQQWTGPVHSRSHATHQPQPLKRGEKKL